MRLVVLLLAASGCSQVFGLESPQRRPPADGSIAEDAAPADADASSCRAKWAQGPQFNAPVLITELSTAAYESDPTVTPDGLTMYFQRNGDIFVAKRTSTSSSWDGATMETSLSSANAEVKLTIAPDGRTGFLSTNRSGSVGGYDIFAATRPFGFGPWSVDAAGLGNVNTTTDQHDPFITADALRLYYASIVALGGQTILVAERNDVNDDFSAGDIVEGIDGAGNEADPTLSDDERLIVYTSTASGKRRLVYSTRANAMDAFSGPTELTALNADVGLGDSDGFLTADMCSIYFASTRSGMGDLYVATLR